MREKQGRRKRKKEKEEGEGEGRWDAFCVHRVGSGGRAFNTACVVGLRVCDKREERKKRKKEKNDTDRKERKAALRIWQRAALRTGSRVAGHVFGS